MARIYLIRHAQASFGSQDYDRLSDLGRRQARCLGDYFVQCDIQFDAIYSGTLRRQRDTAQIVASRLPGEISMHVDARFNEVQSEQHIERLMPRIIQHDPKLAALMERGLTSSKDYQKAIDATFNYWVSPQCQESAIQSWSDFSSATDQALSEVMRAQGAGKNTAIFSSGGTIATIVAQVLGLDGRQIYAFFEPAINCAITRLLYGGERVSLSYFNDHYWLDLLGHQSDEQLLTYR